MKARATKKPLKDIGIRESKSMRTCYQQRKPRKYLLNEKDGRKVKWRKTDNAMADKFG